MPRPTPTRAIRTSLIAALLASAACGRSVTPSGTTAPPPQQDPRRATVYVDVGPMLTHVGRYQAGPSHRHLLPAREPGQQVAVEISALGTSIDIDPLTGPQGFRVIGVLENKDPRYTEAAYGLKPATRYLIWVAPGRVNSGNDSRTRWGLIEYPRTRQGVFPSQPLGYVRWCENYPHPPGARSDVDLRHRTACTVKLATDTGSPFRFASSTPGHVMGTVEDDGLELAQAGRVGWFKCSTGCCSLSDQY